jgi:hypothetical protein
MNFLVLVTAFRPNLKPEKRKGNCYLVNVTDAVELATHIHLLLTLQHVD